VQPSEASRASDREMNSVNVDSILFEFQLFFCNFQVCWCVDRFYARACFARGGWRPKAEELCINADDLLSLVSFILVKSQAANLVSEAAFIEDFISRPMKMHMPGYFLATLQAAIELVLKIDNSKFITREQQQQMDEQAEKDKAEEIRAKEKEAAAAKEREMAAAAAALTPSTAPTPPDSRRPSYLQPAPGTDSPPLSNSGTPIPSRRGSDAPPYVAMPVAARRGPLGQLLIPAASASL
jgi:hypothetical protein